MEALRAPLRAVGRATLATMFITGGADALLDPGPRAQRAAKVGVPGPDDVGGPSVLASG